VRIIKRRTLIEYWSSPAYREARRDLEAWYDNVKGKECDWAGPQDVRNEYVTASIVGDDRVVFNIRGNRFRLVVRIFYPRRTVYIRWFGTHAEYDRIDVTKV